jgi:endonuclease G
MKSLLFIFSIFLHEVVLSQNPSWSFEIPEVKKEDSVIVHTAISLVYSEKHEQAVWVAYQLLRENSSKSLERSNRFLIDPRVSTGTADSKDYLKSGYDRGHLAPAADFGWSVKAMNESFYYSNMSPQLPSFNRGVWKRLETLVRNWATIDSCIYIVTGPILTDSLVAIGPNKVSIPKYYYKVVLDYYSKTPKGIAFIVPNEASSANLSDFATTIKELEKITGINFFPKLNKKDQYILEQQLCISCWTWTSTSTLNTISINDEKSEIEVLQEKVKDGMMDPIKEYAVPLKESVQCTGSTKASKRCGNKTLNVTGKCHLHSK